MSRIYLQELGRSTVVEELIQEDFDEALYDEMLEARKIDIHEAS